MRCFPSRSVRCLLLAALAVLPAAAVAEENGCDTTSFYLRLLKRYSETCMQDNAALQARIEKTTRSLYGGEGSSKAWLEAINSALRTQLADLPAPTAPGSDPYVDALRLNLRGAIDFLADKPSVDAAMDACARLRQQNKPCPIDLGNFEPLNDPASPPKLIEDQKCSAATESDARCHAVYEKAAEIADSTFVARYTVDVVHKPAREKFRAYVTRLGERWHAYLYDSEFQYFWELAGNRYLEEHCDNVLNWPMTKLAGRKCEYVRDPAGNPLGWREVPEYHVVYLHPDVGAQYNSEEPHGDRLKPSLVFQWFGYQWWRWEGSKVSSLRGVSLVTTVSDNKVARTLGHGIQLQVNQYALSITSHGGKPALTLSLNLADKLTKLDQEWADKLKRLSNGGD